MALIGERLLAYILEVTGKADVKMLTSLAWRGYIIVKATSAAGSPAHRA